MKGAATAAGLPESRRRSHVIANLIGTATTCDALLAPAAFESVYFPTDRSA